ncbi:zinc-dependent peptidase [Maribacter sp. 2210JD10-5]|uniref:zinc-dependent peptidase n=1 Tax=Maribacter sp. 2210JD10-5 TaxID=3386272 RepID=UPI0039BC5DE8
MEFWVNVFAIVSLLAIVGYFLYIVYYTLDLFFLNPFQRIPPLTEPEKQLIQAHFSFYKKLGKRNKSRFEKRVVRFRHRKEIVFHEEVFEQEKIALLLSATAAMLTLGMADFLILSIKRIIVYPRQYYSVITKNEHYGEYNPGLKILVLSAEQLLHGFHVPDDNLNLAVHEFAHALSFNVRNKLNSRSFLFLYGMKKMGVLLRDPKFVEQWEKTKYFREYGRTDIHEFFAVAVEHYIETPSEFKKRFPSLFSTVKLMMNFSFYKI